MTKVDIKAQVLVVFLQFYITQNLDLHFKQLKKGLQKMTKTQILEEHELLDGYEEWRGLL